MANISYVSDIFKNLITETNYEVLASTERHARSFLESLKEEKKILFLTTSTRWSKSKEIPKSTQLAYNIKSYLEQEKCQVTILEVPKLRIYPCEGNVSNQGGNTCGIEKALLKDKERNPSGNHRCWASLNNPDDELWKISKALFESDAVIFFGSIRWGQTNSVYQKLIERLTWIENRVTTLKEKPIDKIKSCKAGVVFLGQNWNGKEVMETQKEVLKFFGFQVPDTLSWHWQFTTEVLDESEESYKKAAEEFQELVQITIPK